MKQADIVLFDPGSLSGHHAEYLKHLLKFWLDRSIRGRLRVALSPAALEQHPELARLISEGKSAGVSFLPMRDLEGRPTTDGAHAISGRLRYGEALKRCARENRPQWILLMYFDIYQLSLALGSRFGFPLRLAGIYFRPTLHYGDFANHLSVRDRVRQRRHKILLAGAVRNPHLRMLFCLDGYSVGRVRKLNSDANVVPLADPVVIEEHSDRRRKDIIAPVHGAVGRKLLLLFGALGSRKGIFETLDAVRLLSRSASAKLCLLLIGPVQNQYRERLNRAVESVRTATLTQIIFDDRFVEPDEVQPLFSASDLVLLPYQRFVGSSGVLMHAAATKVPVLGPRYGLLGELIRRHRLGFAVDSSSPRAIADAIEEFVERGIRDRFDSTSARRLAERNSVEKFAATIFRNLVGHQSIEASTFPHADFG